MNYREALAWLYSLQRFGIKLGLENIRRLLAELPVDLRGTRVIHVAGTNGKGSVCAMIDSICRAQGYRTALFISPHLVTFRERIRVNGEMIFEDAVANGLTLIRDLIADWDPHPTFFEVTTALALKYFAEAKLDIVILETGLGGRLDATNAVQSDVSAITPIDFDHEKWLGDSLEKIATEKAGIIKSNIPVVCSSQQIEAEKVIRARAAECEAPLQFVTESYDCSPIALPGQHQKQNAAVAIAAIHAANIDIDDKAIARGLATVECPARFQKWDERTIIDGAHNPSAARVLAKTWREIFSDQRATLILAVLSDKNLRGICEELVPIASSVLLPKIRSERAAPPETLAKVLSSITPSLPHSIVPSLGGTLDLARAKQNPILITGSLHFAGEVLAHLHGEPAAFEECGQ
ncbi:MAG: bifunctional folylpolyglutamate synthase/dihydrofolate synthase [Verrucomicrobia bacterium]|nr:MAG: bifunctional folylpolyglutamate synthase/dihydrofolate synthase [Verrucomicrobiota bacterium]